MKYLILFPLLLLSGCRFEIEYRNHPIDDNWNLCPAPQDENTTRYSKSFLESSFVEGQHLYFTGFVSDITPSTNPIFDGPTLFLSSPSKHTTIQTVIGWLPRDFNKFTPPLKKKEKIKVLGTGRKKCQETVLDPNKYMITIDVWELERVE